ALGTRGELCEQLLVVGVVGLHDLALAELLEPLDGLGSDVVVPVVEVQLVLGGRCGHRGDEQGKQHGESFHGHSRSVCRMLGESRVTRMMSANVSSINRVDTALTSGVTAILIIE